MAPEQNQFISTLQELDEGNLVTDLHHALKQMVGVIRSTGKPGKISLALKIAPAKGNSNVLVIDPRLTVQEPKQEPASTFMYANDDTNELSRNDPRQPKLPGVGPAAVKDFRTAAAGE
jgi:hypothetical protein